MRHFDTSSFYGNHGDILLFIEVHTFPLIIIAISTKFRIFAKRNKANS